MLIICPIHPLTSKLYQSGSGIPWATGVNRRKMEYLRQTKQSSPQGSIFNGHGSLLQITLDQQQWTIRSSDEKAALAKKAAVNDGNT